MSKLEFSGPYFPAFGLNAEIYPVNILIQFEYRKIQTRKNPVFGHFSRSDIEAEAINTELRNKQPKKLNSPENGKIITILGTTIDNKLTFDSHIKNTCWTVGQKFCTLCKIFNYLETSQKKLIFNGMIKSQFSANWTFKHLIIETEIRKSETSKCFSAKACEKDPNCRDFLF